MHEMSVAQEILTVIKKTAQNRKVKKISLRVGDFSGIMIDSLKFGLEVLIKDTIADKAIIEVEKVPVKIICNKCLKKNIILPNYFICPCCNSSDVKIIEGEELELSSLEVDA